MRLLARTFLVLAVGFFCISIAHGQDARATARSTDARATLSVDEGNRAEAERLWELAIAAKGGRERLQSVNNLQVSVNEKYWWLLKRFRYIDESLYVFPDKAWEWNDQRDSIFGFSIRVHNLERNFNWSYLDRGKGSGVTPILEGGRGMKSYFVNLQLNYLMETKWVKPVPVKVEKGKVGRRSVDLVHTTVNEYPKGPEHVAFALDRKTHLPLKVIYYTITRGQEFSGGVNLSDYVEVNGLKMPAKFGGFKTTYQINVEYDVGILERKPDVNAGIHAWKKK